MNVLPSILIACLLTGACLSNSIAQMSDQQLFDQINLDYPELASIKSAVESDDFQTAKQLYVNFLRNRTLPNYPVPQGLPPTYPSSQRKSSSSVSEKALGNTFTVKNVSHTFSTEIDWFFNPTDLDQNPSYQGIYIKEWTNQFNRLNIIRQIADDFHDTGNPIYLEKIDALIGHWIENVPRPPGKAQNTAKLFHPWRSLEVGIRLSSNFPDTWRRCIEGPELRNETVIEWVKSWIEHAEYLVTYPGSKNFLTTESEGLLICGLFFPEMKEAASWRQLALSRLQGQLQEEVYPDGAQMELSPGYHIIVTDNMANSLNLANSNQINVNASFLQTVESMYDYTLHIMQPDLRFPRLNDTRSDLVSSRLVNYASSLFPDRKDFQWVVSDRTQGEPPSHLSHILPWSGAAIMRENWTEQSHYLLMEYGPIGTAHQHQDKLGIQLAAYGDLFVSESGPYLYGPSDLREYSTSSHSHSLLLIDGKGQERSRSAAGIASTSIPYPVVWSSNSSYDFASASYGERTGEEYEGNQSLGIWTRNVLYIKPDIFVILDKFVPNDTNTHTYESYFHLKADQAQVNTSTKQVLIEEPGRPSFSITPLLTHDLEAELVQGQMNPKILGWELDRQGGKTAKPTLVYTTQQKGTTHLAYVFRGAPLGGTLDTPEPIALNTDNNSFGLGLSWMENGIAQEAQLLLAIDTAQSFVWEGNTFHTTGIFIKNGACPIDLETGSLESNGGLGCGSEPHPQTLLVKGKLFLEGLLAQDSASMVPPDSLLQFFPQEQPFQETPLNYSGTEKIDTMPAGTVDWIFLELRDSSNFEQTISRRAALIRADGRLMDVSGSLAVKFHQVLPGSYYLAVFHRAHLPVISSSTLDLGSEAVYYNFAYSAEKVMGNIQQKAMESLGTFALFAGDFDMNGLIDNKDFNLWKQNASRLYDYLPVDVDGNGVINNLDFNLWKKNSSKVGFFRLGE